MTWDLGIYGGILRLIANIGTNQSLKACVVSVVFALYSVISDQVQAMKNFRDFNEI